MGEEGTRAYLFKRRHLLDRSLTDELGVHALEGLTRFPAFRREGSGGSCRRHIRVRNRRRQRTRIGASRSRRGASRQIRRSSTRSDLRDSLLYRPSLRRGRVRVRLRGGRPAVSSDIRMIDREADRLTTSRQTKPYDQLLERVTGGTLPRLGSETC